MKYYDTRRHVNTCLCGYVEVDFANHAISSTQANMLMATCLGCNQILNMRLDIADVIRKVNLNNIVTKNGSYRMINGILVIVPEDYLSGTIEYLCTNDIT